MSTGPSDLIPSSVSTGLAAEAVNIRHHCRTDGSSTSPGARAARRRSATSDGGSARMAANTSSRCSGVEPQG
jgi:hypothetical protein